MKSRFLFFLFFLFFSSGCSVEFKNNLKFQEVEKTDDTGMTEHEEKEINFVELGDKYQLPILLFHHIGEPSENLSQDAKIWYVSEEKFEDILKTILDRGYTPIFMQEAYEYIEENHLPEKSIVVTFDDGAVDFYTKAWPILKKYNIKTSVYLMTGVRGENWLSIEQIKELSASGLVEFGSHTHYHAYLTRISQEEAKAEMEKSKIFLEETLEKPVMIISYPFGLYDENIIDLAEKLGFKAGLTIRSGVWQDRQKPFEFKRNIITNQTIIDNIILEE